MKIQLLVGVIIIVVAAVVILFIYTSAPEANDFYDYPACVGTNTIICTVGQRVGAFGTFIIKSINANNTITVWQIEVSYPNGRIFTRTIAADHWALRCYSGFGLTNVTDLWLASINSSKALFQVIPNATEKCYPP